MTLSIEQLRAAFKTENKSTSRPNNYYPFWDMKTGEQCTIRFLPDKNTDNPHGFVVEKAMHNLIINGEKKNVRCLKPDDCPVCNLSSAYYKDNDEVNGKKYWRKKQHLAQAIIVEDPLPANTESGEKHEGQVRFIALGYQLYNIIQEAFGSGELNEVPYAYVNGCDFVIKKTEQGKYASYAVGSRFVRNESDLTDDQIAIAEDQMIDLATLLPAMPDTAKVESMLEAALTGAAYDEDKPAAKATPTPAAKKLDDAPFRPDKPVADETTTASVEATTASVADEESDEDVDAMLAKIRARQGSKV